MFGRRAKTGRVAELVALVVVVLLLLVHGGERGQERRLRRRRQRALGGVRGRRRRRLLRPHRGGRRRIGGTTGWSTSDKFEKESRKLKPATATGQEMMVKHFAGVRVKQ